MSNISTRCAAKTMLSWLQRVESERWHVPSTSHSSRNVQTKQWNAKISKRIPRPPRVPSGPCATDAHKRRTRTRRFARDVGASSLRAASASVVDHGAVGVRWPERDRSWQITDKTTRRRCESASTDPRSDRSVAITQCPCRRERWRQLDDRQMAHAHEKRKRSDEKEAGAQAPIGGPSFLLFSGRFLINLLIR